MKRNFIYIFLGFLYLLLSSSYLVGQAYDPDNLRKYWFYRYRLTRDFLKVGPNRGESIPAAHRNCQPSPCEGTGALKWGDATIYLGWYISVLATEYKILKDNGFNTTQTAEELYYALEAFNRLDETAEYYYRCPDKQCLESEPVPQPGDLNGFFIRDDVPASLVSNNLNHFNYNPASRLNITGLLESTYQSAIDRTVNNVPAPLPPTSGTHDQVWDIMMGCALVAKLLPSGDSFNGIPFRDGNVSFVAEASAIVDRMITWMNNDFDWAIKNPVTGQCLRGIPCKCICDNCPDGKTACNEAITYNPNTGFTISGGSWDPNNCVFDVNCGSGAWLLSWGAAEAAEEITGNSYPHEVIAPITVTLPFTIPTSTGTFTFSGVLAVVPLDFKCLWQLFACGALAAGIFQNASDEYTKIMTLAAIGHSWKDVLQPSLTCFEGFAESLALTILTTATPIPCVTSVNRTGYKLSSVAAATGKQIYPLLHQVLHGGTNPFIALSTYESLLNIGPCEGPWNFGDGDRAPFQWSGTQRWRSPEQRGDSSPNDRGEYNGLDYMLLHNLYYLQRLSDDGEDSDGNTLPTFMNLMDIIVDFDLPIINPIFEIGTHDNPIQIDAFSTITTDNTINADADVTYRAGAEISLEDGFEVKAGAEFFAFVDPFECVGGSYQKTGGSTALYGMNDSLPLGNNHVPLEYEEEEDNQTTYNTPDTTSVQTLQSGFNIYPNPYQGSTSLPLKSDKLFVDIPGNKGAQVLIVVVDMLGIEHYSKVFVLKEDKYTLAIDPEGKLPAGVYMVIAASDNEIYRKKIVIQ